jgi:hypothetical protein
MVKFSIYFFLVFYPWNNIFAQKIEMPTIAVGVSHRMASLRLNDKPFSRNIYGFNVRVAERDWYFSLDLKQKVFKRKFILELSNYITHTEFRRIQPDPTSLETVTEYGVRRDHFLSLIYPFKDKKDRFKFLLGGGIGYMNLGTKFRFDRFEGYDINGNPIVRRNTLGTLQFFAPKLIVGIEKNRLNGFVIVNGTPDADNDPNPTLWIEFKATYTFKPFEKKGK